MKILLFEYEIFEFAEGDAAGQQTWEALAMLYGSRIFKEDWRSSRSCLEVRSDNITALTMMAKMKATGRGVNIIARELALDMADGCYKPEVIAHVPGITISTVDTLSRKFQPNKPFSLPHILKDVPEKHPPLRIKSFYCTLTLPVLQAAVQAGDKGACISD